MAAVTVLAGKIREGFFTRMSEDNGLKRKFAESGRRFRRDRRSPGTSGGL